MKASVVIYDRNMKKLAYLENAFGVGYIENLNTLWTAKFSLPADDTKNEYCQPLNLVEIFDQGKRVELFRILPIETQKSEYGVNTYQCEHVLATLIDDVLFQYHEIGGVGTNTSQHIQYVLNRQTTTKWVLGECDFTRQFQYKWENESVLGALLSIPNIFDDTYQWTFDTTSMPWKVNLKTLNMNGIPECYIRYKKNQTSIVRRRDTSRLCTRLFGLGYGEGVNQLTISEVNDGQPYIDADTIGQYGVIAKILTDRRFEDANSLKAYMEKTLEQVKNPPTTYEAEAADLRAAETGTPYGNYDVGKIVRVIDKDLGIDFSSVITRVEKSDVTGNPAAAKLVVANKPVDLSTSIADLMDRQRINEVYAQGATNLDSYTFADNCDPQNPAVIKFFIPEDTVRINKMILSFSMEAFRAYSRAIQGGGGIATSTASGGGSNQTSSSGGGTSRSTESGGGTATSTESGGGTSTSTESGGQQVNTNTGSNYWNLSGSPSIPEIMTLAGDPAHRHQIYPHYHLFNVSGHTHDVTIPNHTHNVTIPNHTHNFTVPDHEHSVTIPSHEHSITLPNHIHEIEHGIFRAPVMPTTVAIMVDGNAIPGSAINGDSIDIVPYLAKDGGGRITRGTWHEISATPNTLARIVMDVSSQLFIQSRGGGNF